MVKNKKNIKINRTANNNEKLNYMNIYKKVWCIIKKLN